MVVINIESNPELGHLRMFRIKISNIRQTGLDGILNLNILITDVVCQLPSNKFNGLVLWIPI